MTEGTGKEAGEGERGAESTCTPPTGPTSAEQDTGRDSLGRFVVGNTAAAGVKTHGPQAGQAIMDRVYRVGPGLIDALETDLASTETSLSAESRRREAKSNLTKLTGRAMPQAIQVEQGLSPAGERRLIEILDARPVAALREAINVRAIDVSEEAEPITVRSYKLEGEPGGSEGDEDGEERL